MPDFSCQLPAITTVDNCQDQGGLLTVFWTDSSNIDWEAMATATNYTDGTFSVQSWVLTTGSWNEITFERENGRLDSLYTSGTNYYEVSLLNLLLKGHEKARTIAMGQAIPCCGIIAQVHDNNSKARIIGKEFINGAWVDPVRRLRITRHLDTTGAFGTEDDLARDEFDLTARHSKPLPYSDVDIATMRA
jgi:hypothetical protein